MPRFSKPIPRPGWQRARQQAASKRSHNVDYTAQSNGKVAAKISGPGDSLAQLGDRPGPQASTPTVMEQIGDGKQHRENDRLAEELLQTRTALAESNKLVHELRSLLGQRDSELIRSRSDLQKRSKEIVAMQRQLDDYKSSTTQLQDQIEELTRQQAEVASSETPMEKIRALEAENSKLRQEMDDQKGKSMAILNVISSYESKLQEANQTIKTQAEDIQVVRQENERLTAVLAIRSDQESACPLRSQRRSVPSPVRKPSNSPLVSESARLERTRVAEASPVLSQLATEELRAPRSDSGANSEQHGRTQKRKFEADRTNKKRHTAGDRYAATNFTTISEEVRRLHLSNAEHLVDTIAPPSTPKKTRSSSPKKMLESPTIRSRPSPRRTPTVPTDSLASLGMPDVQKPVSSSSSRRSLKIEIALNGDDSDSSDDTD